MPHRSRVTLELESGSAQICGSVAADGSPPRDFYGWLELMAALDSARGEEVAELGDAPRRDEGQALWHLR